MLVDAISVTPLKDYHLAVAFENGESGIVDYKKLHGRPFTGVFEPLKDENFFRQVRINPEIGVVCWSDQLDVDPVTLYAHATGNFDVLKPYQASNSK